MKNEAIIDAEFINIEELEALGQRICIVILMIINYIYVNNKNKAYIEAINRINGLNTTFEDYYSDPLTKKNFILAGIF